MKHSVKLILEQMGVVSVFGDAYDGVGKSHLISNPKRYEGTFGNILRISNIGRYERG